MRLDELPQPYAARVQAAMDPAAWAAHCADARAAAWLAWNVREDAWYGPMELARVQGQIEGAPEELIGPELLARCASALQRLRLLSVEERGHLPGDGVNHVATARFSYRYEIAGASAWSEGSAPGEIGVALGDRLQLAPRLPGPRFAWLTFEANGRPVPREPDEILRQLGLPWNPGGGTVLRVEVSMGALRTAGADFVLPTLFDALDHRPGQRQAPDWRARPASEHRPGEPWGHARDMQVDGAALPEVIVDITQAGTMNAECVGTPCADWSTRPYLSRSGPR